MHEGHVTNSPSPRRRRRLALWILRGAFAAVLLVGALGGASVWVVTRPWFIAGRVEPVLARLLGGEVTIARAEYLGDGRLAFRDVRLRVRGQPGPAGEVCRIDRASVVIDLAGLLSGRLRVRSVQVDDVLVRLSERRHAAGVFNFTNLTPDWSRADRIAAVLPPRVEIDRAEVEVGVHDGERYERQARTFSGSMRPIADAESWYGLTLIEVDGVGQVVTGDGILVDGRWNVRTNEHEFRLAQVELNERAFAMCPQVVRLWWKEMGLTGRVAKVAARWSGPEGFAVDFEVDDVGLTLPVDTTDMWARYRGGQLEEMRSRARMHVQSGTIQVSRHRIRLAELEGELLSVDPAETIVGVPYRVSVTIDEIPELDWDDTAGWMSEVLSTAPFEMSIRLDEFRVSRTEGGEPAVVELPLAFAQVLERFQFSDWVLSTAVDISRGPPEASPGAGPVPAPILSRGQAFITQASGSYQNFPYRLEDIEAYLEFDNTKVTVHHLTGRGADDATLRLRGTITPTRDVGVSLVLTARDVPVDDRLRDALSDPQRGVFDALLHRPSYDGLLRAGWPVGADAAERAERDFDEAVAARLAAGEKGEGEAAGAAERARLDEAVRRSRPFVEAGPFEPGGLVDLDFVIERADGPDEPTVTTGSVTIHRLGVVYERFPYPVSIREGRLDWTPGRVTLVAAPGTRGMPVVTAGGGRGWLRGHIDLPGKDGRTLRPDLALEISDDAVSDLLLAAIPPAGEPGTPARDGWPGETLSGASAWLRDASFRGTLDYRAEIGSADDAAFDYEIEVDLRDGRADPAAALAAVADPAWAPAPEGWHLEDAAGRITADRDAVRLEGLTGRLVAGRSTGHLEVEGTIALDRAPADLAIDARVDATARTDDLLALLPRLGSARAREIGAELAAEGDFEAAIALRRRDGVVEPVVVHVRPRTVRTEVDGVPVVLTREDGGLRVEADAIRFDDLRLRVDDGTGAPTALAVVGVVSLAGEPGEGPARLEAAWTAAELGSPLVREGIRRLRGSEDLGRLRDLGLSGSFDGVLGYGSSGSGRPPSWDVRLAPRTAAFTRNDTPIALEFEPGGTIDLAPGRLEITSLRARHVGGTVDVEGTIETNAGLDTQLRFGYEGLLMSDEVAALLPRAARDVLTAIELREGGPSVLRDGRLSVVRPPGAGTEVEFSGTVTLEDASFHAGLAFRDLTGPVGFRIGQQPDRPLSVEVAPRPRTVTLLGQRLRDATARVRLADGGRTLLIEDLRADAREGTVTASASVGIGAHRDYAVEVDLIKVPVGDFLIRPPAEEAEGRMIERRGGDLYARLQLAGRRGDAASRVGRGVARVMGAGLADLPLALRLLQPFHGTVPVGEWDYANADFFVAGDRVVFEEILFESSLDGMFLQHLRGDGELDLETFELDAVFRSRGGVLLLSEVVGEIGDQLALIEVTGPLWDPQARVVALPSLNLPRRSIASAPPIVRNADGEVPP